MALTSLEPLLSLIKAHTWSTKGDAANAIHRHSSTASGLMRSYPSWKSADKQDFDSPVHFQNSPTLHHSASVHCSCSPLVHKALICFVTKMVWKCLDGFFWSISTFMTNLKALRYSFPTSSITIRLYLIFAYIRFTHIKSFVLRNLNNKAWIQQHKQKYTI